MNIPQILNKSIEVLKGIVDNADDLAILNVLNSKMANLVSVKNCMFKQLSIAKSSTLLVTSRIIGKLFLIISGTLYISLPSTRLPVKLG